MTDATPASRAVLRELFDAAVAAAHPDGLLARHLPAPPQGRIVLLGAGKAAGSMIAAAEAHYLDTLGLPAGRLTGLGVARQGYGCATRVVPVIEAGHPVPDQAGVDATVRILDLARNSGPDDLVLALLSGGGSANWIAPAGGLTLAEKQAITRALLRSGAVIGEINCVRKHLSRIKGGRLAALAQSARLVSLAISDVPRDEPSAIASGPTVPDPTTLADARAIVAKYAISLPASAKALLDDPRMETPKPGDPLFVNTSFAIVARPADSLAAAADAAHAAGYEPVSLGADVEGEAREVAASHAALAKKLAAGGRRAAILSGGELTVTIRGKGRGGPNQEYALALALALDGARGIAAIAGDTDGTDGGGGAASDPAGAFVDETTLARARAAGLDPTAMLADNDSTGFFAGLGDLLQPGPTRTNVNDLRAILIDPGRAS
ncbi:MAG: glycerate kinase [Rhodoblastus sp.]